MARPVERSPYASHWSLDPDLIFLNHGSFGACPRSILDLQREYRDRLERSPVRFIVDELEPLMDRARADVGAFLDADPDDIAFVPNATAGVNAVMRSLDLRPGDELLATDHEYNACLNTLRFVAERTGARVVIAEIPTPVAGPEDVIRAVMSCVTERTRIALLSHVTSPSALIFPVERLVPALQDRGVDVLVDGAHGPGMIDLHLNDLGAAYYAGNFHKWTCAPKGAGFLHVRRDRQRNIRPAIISHGANAARTDRSRFRVEFDWTGTADPTPYLCVAPAMRFVEEIYPGGWSAVRRDMTRMTRDATELLIDALAPFGAGVPTGPPEMRGMTTSLTLPDGAVAEPPTDGPWIDPDQTLLLHERAVEVPFIPWPAPPRRHIRISAHIHNAPDEYRALADALRERFAAR